MSDMIDRLPDLFAKWDEIYEDGCKHTKVVGNLTEQAAELPGHQGYYGAATSEITSYRKRMEAIVRHKRGMLFRFYSEKYPKALGARDIDQYINSDAEYSDLNEILLEIMQYEGKFESLMTAYTTKNWQISNVTKLYVVGLEDIEI